MRVVVVVLVDQGVVPSSTPRDRVLGGIRVANPGSRGFPMHKSAPLRVEVIEKGS